MKANYEACLAETLNLLQPIDSILDTVAVCRYAFLKARPLNPLNSGNIGNRPSQAFPFVADASAVFSLRLGRRPPTVTRFVSHVGVNSIKCHARGAFPQVEIKAFERHPPGANRNPAPSVVGKLFVVFIKTPPLHRHPRYVSGGSSHTMSDIADRHPLFFVAAATSRFPGMQIVTRNNRFASAVTTANPLDPRPKRCRPAVEPMPNDKPAKPLSRPINKLSQKAILHA